MGIDAREGKKIRDIDELQERIIEEWEWLDQSVIDSAVD